MTSKSSSKPGRKTASLIASFFRRALLPLHGFLLASLCVGCASGPNPADPWEQTNRFIYNVNDGIDRVALKPASDIYVKVVPPPVRNGIGNGFDNLSYFNVIFNDFLQARWGQGTQDLERMAVNSTIGIGGIFDVGTPWHLPAHDNDFGLTLAQWGYEPGPYLVLPIFGPSTVRDAPGIGVDIVCTPTTWLDLPLDVWLPLAGAGAVDARSRADKLARFRNEVAVDPYIFTRDAYLQYRANEVSEHVHHQPIPQRAAPPSLYDENFDNPSAPNPPVSNSQPTSP